MSNIQNVIWHSYDVIYSKIGAKFELFVGIHKNFQSK